MGKALDSRPQKSKGRKIHRYNGLRTARVSTRVHNSNASVLVPNKRKYWGLAAEKWHVISKIRFNT